jgi:DNA polymerase III epsilon subunit-like protein
MKFLVYDTETTGLLPKKKDGEYPHIVQFSYIVFDTEKCEIVHFYDEIIRVPDEVEIPKVASDIHHITTEMSRNSTVLAIDCILHFICECKKVDMIIGHNIPFDNAMVECELERHKKKVDEEEAEILERIIYRFNNMKFYCTMKESTEYCNLVRTYRNSKKTYVKYPKLIELHDKLFGEGTMNIQLHNSLNDVFMCFRCFYKFKYDEDMISIIPVKTVF